MTDYNEIMRQDRVSKTVRQVADTPNFCGQGGYKYTDSQAYNMTKVEPRTRVCWCSHCSHWHKV
jgi:hypothetical protein